MAVSPVWRRVSRHFSISAPRMAVRRHLGWRSKSAIALALIVVVGGMWWWGFDFGQFLGGFNRKEIEQRLATLKADADTAQREATALRAQNAQLESDLAMMRGLQTTLSRQLSELQRDNAALKDEVAFLQTFFEGSAKPGLAVQRLSVEASGEAARYSLLVVRGGTSKSDFEGHVALAVELVPAAGAGNGTAPRTLEIPSEPSARPQPMALRFKYYQRLEGTFGVPPGYAVRAVTARVYETGTTAPRATRAVTLP